MADASPARRLERPSALQHGISTLLALLTPGCISRHPQQPGTHGVTPLNSRTLAVGDSESAYPAVAPYFAAKRRCSLIKIITARTPGACLRGANSRLQYDPVPGPAITVCE